MNITLTEQDLVGFEKIYTPESMPGVYANALRTPTDGNIVFVVMNAERERMVVRVNELSGLKCKLIIYVAIASGDCSGIVMVIN